MWLFRWFHVCSVILLMAFQSVAADEKQQRHWLVVTAPAYRQALEPLCRHRQSQGFQVKVIQTTDILTAREILANDANKLRSHLGQQMMARQKQGPVYVLLVGAVEGTNLPEPATKVMPPLRGTVSRMKGQPTDHGYGNPGKDFVATAAVGRLPARSVAEAQAMVKKIIAIENDKQPGEWRRRLTVLAGVPAFNPVVDAMVEKLALARLARISPSWSGRAIYHNTTSRFCLPDRELQPRALKYVQAGQALTLYLGHSGPHGFWAGGARFLNRDDWARLKIARGAGVFATFGCNGCQLSGKSGEGYGVAAIRNPHGPAAVLGSHGICFAAMVQLAADGLFQSMLAGKPPERLGEVWLRIQRDLAKAPLNPLTFRLLDAVDGDSRIPQPVQRREHLEMFVLLGDPALRLPHVANSIRLQSMGDARPGGTIRVLGSAPADLEGASIRLKVERPLTSEPLNLAKLPAEKGIAHQRIMRANHDRANDFVLAEQTGKIKNSRFEVEVKLPKPMPWPKVLLRVYAATRRADAVGSLSIPIKKDER